MVDVEALYRSHGPMVLRRCRRLLGDEHRALDAMQDTFVAVLRSELRLTDNAPSSLLFRIATNVCLNKLRSERRRPSGESQTAEGEPLLDRLVGVCGRDEVGLARRMLSRLFAAEPPTTLQMAVLHYHDGMTLEEVAAELGMSVSGVRKRLRTLRGRIGVDDVAA